MGEIREPIKKSSKEKKQKIIQKGFELMCKEGYHNVTCVDIAKYAEVSTGIIYQYFKDKKDIFKEGVKNYSDKIIYPMYDELDKNKDLKDLIIDLIESYISSHTISKKEHQELISMANLDTEMQEIFCQKRLELTEKIVLILKDMQITPKDVYEKVHISINMVDSLCHEIIYHHHDILNYEKMKEITVNIIYNLLKEEK